MGNAAACHPAQTLDSYLVESLPSRRSSVVEQLFRKQQVDGSNPPAGSRPHSYGPGHGDSVSNSDDLSPPPIRLTTRDAAAPFGFVCQPEDIANAVAFLCGSEERYITNQRITVDGGGF